MIDEEIERRPKPPGDHDSNLYDLKGGPFYHVEGDTYLNHGKDRLNTLYRDLTCGKCGHDTFKIRSMDRSCPGCGSGDYQVQVCAKCGAFNE